MENANVSGRSLDMKKIMGFTLSLLVLGITAGLTLANPLRVGVEHGMKKGWFKPNRKS
jgi:hypothetical protein